MHQDDKNAKPESSGAWRVGRGQDETHAFIVRVRLSFAAGGNRRPQFSLEEVGAGPIHRFANFALVADHLARRVEEILARPPGDTAHH